MPSFCKLSGAVIGGLGAFIAMTSVSFADATADQVAKIDAQIAQLMAQKQKLTKGISSASATQSSAVSAKPSYSSKRGFEWVGVYGGLHAVVQRQTEFDAAGSVTQVGYGSDNGGEDVVLSFPYKFNGDPAQAPLTSSTKNVMDFNGGAELGYNHQFGALVLGAAVDYTTLNAGANVDNASLELGKVDYCFNYPEFCVEDDDYNDEYNASGLFSSEDKISGLGTARVRIGLGFDRLLIFGTGGVAVGNVSHSVSVFGDNYMVDNFVPEYRASKSGYKVGWTAGGGLEYAVSDFISIKADFLYYDLGETDLSGSVNDGDTPAESLTVNYKVLDTGEFIRLGVNAHF
jgi:outer membrane immunogenic protein